MKKHKPILHILAGRAGVHEIRVTLTASEYDEARAISLAIKPAISIIDKAIRDVDRNGGE